MKIRIVILCMFFLAGTVQAWAAERVTMDIKGMTCALCPIAIKKSLSRVEGVDTVKVSFAKKKAWLEVEDNVSDAQLQAAVKRAGSYSTTITRRVKMEKR